MPFNINSLISHLGSELLLVEVTWWAHTSHPCSREGSGTASPLGACARLRAALGRSATYYRYYRSVLLKSEGVRLFQTSEVVLTTFDPGDSLTFIPHPQGRWDALLPLRSQSLGNSHSYSICRNYSFKYLFPPLGREPPDWCQRP